MSDLQESLHAMLDEDGVDKDLLKDKEGQPLEKSLFHFTVDDQIILRQYECAAEPVIQLSKFFQLNVPTVHLVLIHLRVRISEMKEDRFMMYGDISYTNLEVLTNRRKTELVINDNISNIKARQRNGLGRVEKMDSCIVEFRDVFAEDFSWRCGLTFQDENGHMQDVEELPKDIAIGALLHPLLGGEYFCLSKPNSTTLKLVC